MSEKEVLSRDENNIPFEGGLAAFPPASHQEVGVGSAQTENRGDREEPEPSMQTCIKARSVVCPQSSLVILTFYY